MVSSDISQVGGSSLDDIPLARIVNGATIGSEDSELVGSNNQDMNQSEG